MNSVINSPSGPSKLAVTYSNDTFVDGAGAQLQRIYGIYAISRFMGFSYLHTPMADVSYQGLSALENKSTDSSFVADFNRLFEIKSDPGIQGAYYIANLHDVNTEILEDLRKTAAVSDMPILARITMPYGVTDRHPQAYRYCKYISPFSARFVNRQLIRIALHVRRGEIMFNAPERLLPNQYYINIALRAASILQSLGIPYQIELHTEVASEGFVVTSEHHQSIKPDSPFKYDTSNCGSMTDFDVLPNLVKRFNEKAIDCLTGLATADILIMSRSSFSYVAAILNKPNAVVVYFPFWHSPMDSWIVADLNDSFNQRLYNGIAGMLS